jgi:dynein heavy chain 2
VQAQLQPDSVVGAYLTKLFTEWREAIPLLKFVRGEGMLPEHWNEMFRLLDIEKGMTSDKLNFGHILDRYPRIIQHESELKALHGRAQGEVQIRDALQELRTWSLEQCFSLVAQADSGVSSGTRGPVMLITDWKDILTQVSDHQALLNSLKDSSYYPRFADEAGVWEQKLLFTNDCLLLLNNIQRRWVYLEPLFARGALPHEQQRFKRVDKEFVAILKEVEADPRVMSLATHTDYVDKLKAILEQIERCQKALNEFLEQKRDKFPRFYFISDEDLLEVLGQSKSPTVIQSHLKKLFMGINTVRFNGDSTAITHMISSDGEVVPLATPIAITDPDVEDWLIRLDECMRKTLRALLAKCCTLPTATTLEAIQQYPSQILQTAEQIIFTRDIETRAMPRAASGGFMEARQAVDEKLDRLTAIDVSQDYVLELKVKALIMDVIHMGEVCDQLTEAGAKAATDWQWQKQLRYYLQQQGSEECVLRMIDTQFKYSFEYQGNAAKLVHTPLTDRCYLTLTKGMHLGYGGNLYGPAGTGKTESVKALGGALGRQVLVFNCDEGIDFKAMGRIFVGIVKCGAWGCFDEFNRLKVDQLSAISQMIQVIQEALKQGEPTCMLLDRTVDVSPNSGIFVTLNPAGKGYGGRSKLPDNLKLLFRAVAMSVPNSELITETMLLSEGFQFAKALAPKVVEVYKLSKQLLSAQQHYDWGLRPLKAVLRLGGALVQKLRKDKSGAPRTESVEAELMVQSLRVNTLSKLTFTDALLFNGIIDDIFPRIAVRDIKYEELAKAVADATDQLGLQRSATQVHKVMQLYEAMNQRMGVVLVGPSGSGKSTLLKILRRALELLGTEVPLHVMNPKALPRQQLLGHMDIDTREWFDGILSSAARKVVKEASTARSWIFCDGDIDPEWVESLNSVLDDNRLLTMPNGVRIQFGSNVNFVFETHSLQYASPATVSRMGIIFLSQEDVEPRHVVASYAAARMSDESRARVLPWVTDFAFPLISDALEQNQFSVETTQMGLVNAVLAHTEAAENLQDFACRLMRALCGFMPIAAQTQFAQRVFDKTRQTPVNRESPLDSYYDPAKGREETFALPANIQNEVSPTALVAATASDVPMVRTFEVQRTLKTLEPLIAGEEGKPFFLVGPEGCGKTLILNRCFDTLKSVKIASINCSAQTTSAQVIQKLQQQCTLYSTSSGKVLRPKDADRLVLCFKDISLPKPDKYGTVMLHSLLQQLLLYRGFYDEDLEWVGVERVQIVGSMTSAISSTGVPMSPRLLAIVNIVTLDTPTEASLNSGLHCLLLSPCPHGAVRGRASVRRRQGAGHVLHGPLQQDEEALQRRELPLLRLLPARHHRHRAERAALRRGVLVARRHRRARGCTRLPGPPAQGRGPREGRAYPGGAAGDAGTHVPQGGGPAPPHLHLHRLRLGHGSDAERPSQDAHRHPPARRV